MDVTCRMKNLKKVKKSEDEMLSSLSPDRRIISEYRIICRSQTVHVVQRWNKLVDYGVSGTTTKMHSQNRCIRTSQ